MNNKKARYKAGFLLVVFRLAQLIFWRGVGGKVPTDEPSLVIPATLLGLYIGHEFLHALLFAALANQEHIIVFGHDVIF